MFLQLTIPLYVGFARNPVMFFVIARPLKEVFSVLNVESQILQTQNAKIVDRQTRGRT